MRKERILLFIFLILMLIVLMPFTSAVIEGWSNWYDYSDPSSGGGDYETYDVVKSHVPTLCNTPIGVGGRTHGTHNDWTTTGQTMTCTPTEGLICNNADNPGQGIYGCFEYDVRFFCPTICGSGIVGGLEQCDDGNTAPGDGCSPICSVEPGYFCRSGSPSECMATGWTDFFNIDGWVNTGDPNFDDGDYERLGDLINLYPGQICLDPTGIECLGWAYGGETPGTHWELPSYFGDITTCEPDVGSICNDADQADGHCTDYKVRFYCDVECGDNYVSGGEACDDGNTAPGDGCSSSCNIETGFACVNNNPSDCDPVCGDGLILGGEQCDDDNTDDYDGCTSYCHQGSGYICTGEPSNCNTVCGDWLIRGDEECDDANGASGDGCSNSCQIEPGYQCEGYGPGSCFESEECGDGYITGNENCDDFNGASGDGCSSTCQQETGYNCNNEPGTCDPICGDGLIRGGEQCDDDDLEPGDGCSSVCVREAGYSCINEPSQCSETCGNGVLNSGEECDDNNIIPKDGCSSSCRLEEGECYNYEQPDNMCASFHNNQPFCVDPTLEEGCLWKFLTCTDADLDTYAIEGGLCGPVDCNDGIQVPIENPEENLMFFILNLFSRNSNNVLTGHVVGNNIPPRNINPGVNEICGNNIDENCDGVVEACPCQDVDGDGYGVLGAEICPNVGRDCNDSLANIHPGVIEICGNEIDDNCNYQIDEFCSYYSINEFYHDGPDFFENADLSSACIFTVTGDLNMGIPGVETFVPESCIEVYINGSSEGCDVVETAAGNDTIYKSFTCDVGSEGLNKPIFCAVNEEICNPGLNASSNISFLDVTTPLICPGGALTGPMLVEVNEDFANKVYTSGEVLDLNFDITNVVVGQDLNLFYEAILYNLNTQELFSNINQEGVVSTVQSFGASILLPYATETDKFRLYFKVSNPLDESGMCVLHKYDLNILPSLIANPDAFDFDFRNYRSKTFLIALGESKTFTLDGVEGHSIEISNLIGNATLTFSSEPQNISLDIGGHTEIDLDGDGSNDLLLFIKDKQASLVEVELTILGLFESCSTGDIRACKSGKGIQLCLSGIWTECDVPETEAPTIPSYKKKNEGIDFKFEDLFSLEFYWYIIIGVILLLLFIFIITLIMRDKIHSVGDVSQNKNGPAYPPKPKAPFSPGMQNIPSRVMMPRR